MSVESWDPGSANTELTSAILALLLEAASCLDESDFGLTADQVKTLAGLARHGDAPGDADWTQALGLENHQLLALVRLFTLAEQRLAGWDLGAKSPVIPLVAELRRRGALPDDLTRWIRSNTSNRFLPHGSLLDRL